MIQTVISWNAPLRNRFPDGGYFLKSWLLKGGPEKRALRAAIIG